MITDSELLQLRRDIYLALVAKSGVREWEQPEVNQTIWIAALDAADGLFGITDEPIEGGGSVALPEYFKQRIGTAIVLASSGGDYAISLASVASVASGSATTTGARQCVTIDLADSAGNLPVWVDIVTEFELAATPTAGSSIAIHGFFWSATGASLGGSLGTDSAYTGISNNVDATLLGSVFLGNHICTANATSTVQKLPSGGFKPKNRYLNLIVRNMSGASFHSTNTNQKITLFPTYDVVQDTETGA
jgi:hypothetical protein